MNSTVLVINIFALVCLMAALMRDRSKVRQSFAVALKSFLGMTPTILILIILIGILWSFLPPDKISGIVGKQSGLGGILLIAVLGAVVHIPALLSFPLAASFLDQGASVAVAAAFITTLTMIGTVTLPLEIQELGGRLALLRNGISFIIAIIIALLMGVVL